MSGYPKVQVQVNFVAATDNKGNITDSWWSFAPDTAQLLYTGAAPPARPDELSWKLTARKIDGSKLSGVVFAPSDGVHVDWTFPQPTRQHDKSVYAVNVPDDNPGSMPQGPYKFTAAVEYKGQTYSSPDPSVVLEPRDT